MDATPMIATSALFWAAVFVYTKNYGKFKGTEEHFGSNTFWLDVHSIVGMVLGALSLTINDEEIFSESIVLSWAAGHFIVDLYDCIERRDVMFSGHAVVALSLTYICSTKDYYDLRAGSRGYFVEFSTLFFHQWRQSKSKANFFRFYLTFFVCRIVYTPFFLYQLLPVLKENVFAQAASLAFYLLQCLWFAKGTQMLFNYKEDDKPQYEPINE